MQERDIFDSIFGWLGIDGASALALLLFISMLSNFLYRLIPDDATGWLGQVKPILRVIGLYASNRISSGITVNDVAKEAIDARVREVGDRVEQGTDEIRDRIDHRIEEVVDQTREEIESRTGIDFGRASDAARRIVPE